MKKSIFCVISAIFLSFSTLFAQDESVSVTIFALPDSFATMVFADKANVRQSPKKDAATVTQLVAGTEVLVISHDTTTVEINGWPSCFHKIQWKNAGEKTTNEGWIWGGLLSPTPLKSGDISFVYGITKSRKTSKEVEVANEHSIEIRAIQAEKIVATTAFIQNFGAEFYASAAVSDNRGFAKAKNILSVHFFYPACGYPNIENTIIWDGKNFETLPKLESIGDAGVFNYSESYIFPKDENGIESGQILYKMEQSNVLDDEMLEFDAKTCVRVLKKVNGKWAKPKIKD